MGRNGELPVGGVQRSVDELQVVPAPVVFCPFQPHISPYAADVSRYAMAWATRHGFLDTGAAAARFARAKFAYLAARAYPDADKADLYLAMSVLTLIVMLDDHLESSLGRDPDGQRAAAAGVLSYLRGAPESDHRAALAAALTAPLAGAIGDVWTRLTARTGPAWRARFVEHVARYLAANAWEADNRRAGRVPTIGEYLSMRRHSSATALFFDLIEALGAELSGAVRSDPALTVLVGHAHNIVAWFNDIVSWRKELRASDWHNMVLVVRNELGVPLTEAVRRVAARHDAEVHAFVARRAALPAEVRADPAVTRFITGLTYWIRGNIDWSRDSGRYAPPEGAAAGA